MNRFGTLAFAGILILGGLGCNRKGFVAITPDQSLSLPSLSGLNPKILSGPGVIDAGCMANTAYDACIFFKNPVAQRGAGFAAELNFGSDLAADQIYGVKLVNQSDLKLLKSSSITVTASGGKTAAPVDGAWKFAYKDDVGVSYVAQLMAYSWLTFQEQQMTARSGTFYASGKGIPVDAYDSRNVIDLINNAYWDGINKNIKMGTASLNGGKHEMALGAEVYLHEMGHGNFDYAHSPKEDLTDLNATYNANGGFCKTEQGCLDGINEGQADFHFLIIFQGNTGLAETLLNSPSGLPDRDVKQNKSVSLTGFYNRSLDTTNKIPGGEIHDMGAAYASILYNIYTDPGMVKTDFEAIFTLHLPMLNGNTRFPEARNFLVSISDALFAGKYNKIITDAFNNRGVAAK